MSEKYHFDYVHGQYRIYKDTMYVATVHTESSASTLVAELNSVYETAVTEQRIGDINNDAFEGAVGAVRKLKEEKYDLQAALAAETERADALQAENARLVARNQALQTFTDKVASIMLDDSQSAIDVWNWISGWMLDLPKDPTPRVAPTPEAEAPMWCPVEHPIHSGKYTVRIIREADYQYDTPSYVNPYEFEEDAWNRADELNSTDNA